MVADDLGEAWARGVMARGGRVVRVTYPRTANNDKELTVVRGEYLEVRTLTSTRAHQSMACSSATYFSIYFV